MVQTAQPSSTITWTGTGNGSWVSTTPGVTTPADFWKLVRDGSLSVAGDIESEGYVGATAPTGVQQSFVLFFISNTNDATSELNGLKLLRPHVKATDLRIVVEVTMDDSAFVEGPTIELVDDITKGIAWDPTEIVDEEKGFLELEAAGHQWAFARSVYKSAPLVNGTNTLTLDSELIRGKEKTLPNGGVRDFGDLAIKLNTAWKGSAGDSALCEIDKITVYLEEVEPYADRSPDWGVRLDAGTWKTIDYKGAAGPVNGEFTTLLYNASTALSSANATIDAIRRCGEYGTATDPKVVEIEALPVGTTMANFVIGGSGGSDGTAYWRNPGLTSRRPIDKLVIRSVDRTPNGRAQFGRHGNQSGGPMFITVTNSATHDARHVAFAGVRFYCSQINKYCVQSEYDQWSSYTTLGAHDVHAVGSRLGYNQSTGETNPRGQEFEMAFRLGYHAFDATDSFVGPAGQHFAYWGVSSGDSQMLRSENVNSKLLYPANPEAMPNGTGAGNVQPPPNYNPEAGDFGGGFLGRTFHQRVGRTESLEGSGGGPPGGGHFLVEDCRTRNHGPGGGSFTLVPLPIGDYILRRSGKFTRTGQTKWNQGQAVQIWNVAEVAAAQGGSYQGNHCSIGQLDGHNEIKAGPWGHNTASGVGKTRGNPEHFPESGTAFHTGDVLIEDYIGVSASQTSLPINTGGCRSVTVRRGAYKEVKVPIFGDCENDGGGWTGLNSGFLMSLAWRFEHMGATPATYSGFPPSQRILLFGHRNNPRNTGGGAGTVQSAELTVAQVNALQGPNDAWPPWPQGWGNFDYDAGGTHSNIVGIAGRVYPGFSPPRSYGGQPITYPGFNTCDGIEVLITPTAVTVGNITPTVGILLGIVRGQADLPDPLLIGVGPDALTGDAAGAATTVGTLTGISPIEGDVRGMADVVGLLGGTQTVAMVGDVEGVATVTGTPSNFISGDVQGTSRVTGDASGFAAIPATPALNQSHARSAAIHQSHARSAALHQTTTG